MKTKALIILIIGIIALLLSACAGIAQASPGTPEQAGQIKQVQLQQAVGNGSTSNNEEAATTLNTNTLTYPIVDTGQEQCFDNFSANNCPSTGQTFNGQDAQYSGNQPAYVDNGDGTVTDLVTGLMWQQTPGDKVTFAEALAGAETLDLGGYNDWWLPTIKELYTLIDFSGVDPSGWNGTDTSQLVPFIDTDYFNFEYGDTSAGERIIDAQYWSSTEYVGTTMGGSATTFGVNFADGRIKGYGREHPGGEMTQFVRYVRGNTSYGINDFNDISDGTITDLSTGLMWMQSDSGSGMIWEDALTYCENLEIAGYSDWRLPNAKELQSIVDYSRSPSTSNSPAIDPLFNTTSIIDEAGDTNYPFYWSSTTHENMMNGSNAAYVTFGEALGYMNGAWIDVHGAGAQRSDPKEGDPGDFPYGHGPQGDAIRIYNFVRCVRDADPASGSDYSGFLPLITQEDQNQNHSYQQSTDQQAVPNGQPPEVDLASAAAKLGVRESELRAALGPPPPDLAAAAQKLGITEEALIEALGIPQNRNESNPPNQQP
jgi:hypothetical protein